MKHKLSTPVVVLLTSISLYALPESIARWNADGDVQPEPGGKARTVNSEDIAYKQGVAGKAFSFNGKSSVIEAELVAKSPGFTTMTWSVWLRPNESAGDHTILSDGYSNEIAIINGQLTIFYGGHNKRVAPVKWGAWQHVAVVYGPDHVIVYHRGGTATIPLRAEEPSLLQKALFIGRWRADSRYYSGLIDEVSIYDRELTEDEITELSTRPNGAKRDETTKPTAQPPGKSTAKSAPEWINTEGKAIAADFVRIDGNQVVLKIEKKEITIPFAKLAKASIEQAKALDAANRIADSIAFGEQQSEADHQLKSEVSNTGDFHDRKYRHAGSGGYIEFQMKTLPDTPYVLSCTYWGDDYNRVFDIIINGKVIATQLLNQDKPGQFYDVEYPIPADLLAGHDKVTVRFVPKLGSIAGGFFGATLLKSKK